MRRPPAWPIIGRTGQKAEGALALPQGEFGLDVIALVGRLRFAEYRSMQEIHAALARDEEPVTLMLAEAPERTAALPRAPGRDAP